MDARDFCGASAGEDGVSAKVEKLNTCAKFLIRASTRCKTRDTMRPPPPCECVWRVHGTTEGRVAGCYFN